jgi:hypothetical protein
MFRFGGYDVLVMEDLLNLVPFILAGLPIAGGNFPVLSFPIAK